MSAGMEAGHPHHSAPPGLSLAEPAIALGLSCFPCNLDRVPVIAGGFKAATRDPAAIRRMFSTPDATAIGIPTGQASDLIVVDPDVKHGARGMEWYDANRHILPRTRTHRTQTGGLHLFFRPPPGVEIRNSQDRIAPGVDVRGEGGYVLYPPTPGYTVEDDAEPAEMPLWLIKECQRPEPTPREPAPRRERSNTDPAHGSRYGERALADECDAIRRASFGHQEQTINEAGLKIGGLVAGGELEEEPALAELLAAARSVPSAPDRDPWSQRELEAKVRRGFADGQRRPRPAPLRAEPLRKQSSEPKAPPADRSGYKARANAPERGTRIGKLLVRSVGDAAAAPPRDYYLKGLISPGELSLWWGDGGAGKTFFLLLLSYMLALGRQVLGRRVKSVRVLYLALEGEGGIEGRIEALRREYGDAEGFAYIAQPVNLFNDADAIADLKDAIREHRAGLVIVDTLNRAIGGGSESADGDMGRLRGTFDQIRHETGAHVAVIHHGGKDETRGPRGHSGLLFATDLTVKLAEGEGGARTATVTRVKEGEAGVVFGYSLRKIELGIDADGDPIVTALAEEAQAAAPSAPRTGGPKLHDEAVSLLRHMQDLLAEGQGKNDRPELGMPFVPTLSRNVLHEALIRRGWLLLSEKLSKDGKRSESVSDAEWKRLYKRMTSLKINGFIGFNRLAAWLAKPAEMP